MKFRNSCFKIFTLIIDKSFEMLICCSWGFLFSSSKWVFINKLTKLHIALENRSAEFLWSNLCKEKICPEILWGKGKSSRQKRFNYALWRLNTSFCEDEKCFRCSCRGLPALLTGHLLLVPTGKMRKQLNQKKPQ